FVGEISRRRLVNIVVPLNDAAGRRVGLLAAALDLEVLSRTLLSVNGLPEGSIAGLIDADDTYIARNPGLDRYVGTTTKNPAIGAARRLADAGRTVVGRTHDGVDAVLGLSSLRNHRLSVGIAEPLDAVSAATREDFRNSSLATLAMGLVGLLAALYGARRLS